MDRSNEQYLLDENSYHNYEKENVFDKNNCETSGTKLNENYYRASPLKTNSGYLNNVDVVFETPIKECGNIEELNSDIVLPLNSDASGIKDDFSVISKFLKYLNDSCDELEPVLIEGAINENCHMPEKKIVQRSSYVPENKLCTPKNDSTTSSYINSQEFHDYNIGSPELFSEDEMYMDMKPSTAGNGTKTDLLRSQEKNILKKLQGCFKGIVPPPSVSECQLSVEEIVNRYYSNKDNCDKSDVKMKQSFVANCSEETARTEIHWPDVLKLRHYGLQYNYSTTSEELELLYMKYIDRFIGNETSAFCSTSSQIVPKKKTSVLKQNTCKSPGRRLSHLARRRITFSKDNLNTKRSVLPSISMSNRQILVGVKRNDILMNTQTSQKKRSPRKGFSLRKLISPRKKTPRKSPLKSSPRKRIKTPNKPSTSKVTTFKRALFLSPELKVPKSNERENDKVNKSKRALFVTDGNIPLEECRKRKRSELDDDFTPQREKFPRSFSTNDTEQSTTSGTSLMRRNSELINTTTNEFSDHHKKKLLWAISTALRSQQIGLSHPKFKTYAATLSQICKQLLTDLLPGSVRLPGSVNERMAKLAQLHVYDVVKGKSATEIIQEIKSKTVSQKPKGYIAPEYFDSSIQTEHVSNSQKNSTRDCSKIRRQITFDKFA